MKKPTISLCAVALLVASGSLQPATFTHQAIGAAGTVINHSQGRTNIRKPHQIHNWKSYRSSRKRVKSFMAFGILLGGAPAG